MWGPQEVFTKTDLDGDSSIQRKAGTESHGETAINAGPRRGHGGSVTSGQPRKKKGFRSRREKPQLSRISFLGNLKKKL